MDLLVRRRPEEKFDFQNLTTIRNGLTSPAEFVMLIASILANYALLPRREGLCVLMMADD